MLRFLFLYMLLSVLPTLQSFAWADVSLPFKLMAPNNASKEAHVVFPNVFTRERVKLLQQGEAALKLLDTGAAIDAFERAGYLLHASDAETALVRAYMQAGQYRHAVAYAAHTAGMHPTDPTGSALYAWLLHLGGQSTMAQQVLSKAEQRLPADPLLAEVRNQLQTGLPQGAPLLHSRGLRFMPYSAMIGGSASTSTVPANALVAGSGVLIDGGRRALVPLGAIGDGNTVWLRNGLGQTSQGEIEQRIEKIRLAVVRLDAPLPAADVKAAEHTPFPGSIGYAVQYPASHSDNPAWPVLIAGFIGSPVDGGQERMLGIELPDCARGSAVFDSAGHLAGIAVSGKNCQENSRDKMIPVSRLQEYIGLLPLSNVVSPMGGTGKRPSVDVVYESAMRLSLQVMAVLHH